MDSNSNEGDHDSTDAEVRSRAGGNQNAEEALARWVLGLASRQAVYSSLLSRAAEAAHSNALLALGQVDLEASDSMAWVESVAQQMGVRVPNQTDAARYLAVCVSRRILSGELDPFAGARELGEISRAVEGEKFHDFDAFIYAESEAEDRPEDHHFFRDAIVKEARRWAGMNEPADR
jgi:hypothetical protein